MSSGNSKIVVKEWSIETSQIKQDAVEASLNEAEKTDGETQNAWEFDKILSLHYGKDEKGIQRFEALIAWLDGSRTYEVMSNLYGGPDEPYGCGDTLKVILEGLSEEDRAKVRKAADECQGEQPWKEKFVEWCE